MSDPKRDNKQVMKNSLQIENEDSIQGELLTPAMLRRKSPFTKQAAVRISSEEEQKIIKEANIAKATSVSDYIRMKLGLKPLKPLL